MARFNDTTYDQKYRLSAYSNAPNELRKDYVKIAHKRLAIINHTINFMMKLIAITLLYYKLYSFRRLGLSSITAKSDSVKKNNRKIYKI